MIRPLAVLLAAFAILAQPARADDYPTRPVRLIVGFAAGSSGDVIARIVAHKLSELLKQNVVVEDKPGASSMVATDYVARSAKDGYTLIFATIATTINMTLMPALAPNVEKDMTPITLVGSIPNIIVVNPKLGVSDVRGLIALAKEKPNELLYGASGLGSGPHLATELFKQMAGVKMTGVLYPGSGQTAVDLIAGRIQVMFAPAPTVLGLITDGRVQAAGHHRSQAFKRRARPADSRRGGAARLRRRPLVRHTRPGRTAQAGDRQTLRSNQCGVERSDRFARVAKPGPQCRRRQPGGFHPLHQERNRALGPRHQVHGRGEKSGRHRRTLTGAPLCGLREDIVDRVAKGFKEKGVQGIMRIRNVAGAGR